MTPYYQDDAVTIYHGDCREVMPSLTFDAIVMDPPYGTKYYATDTEVVTPQVLADMAARTSGVALFGYPERLAHLVVASGCQITEWVTWWPTNGAIKGNNMHGLWKESECIAIIGSHRMSALRRPRTPWTGKWVSGTTRYPESNCNNDEARLGDVWTDAAPGLAFQSHNRLHPNEKPVGVMTRLVDGMSAAPAVTLDPFMGSGTTLRAAKDLGRRAIGIEISEAYCEIAARRMGQEVLAF